jgi:hypothetical protein
MDISTLCPPIHETLFDVGSLYAYLNTLEDRRHAKGKRYRLGLILLVTILAKLCGEDTPFGIAEWARLRAKQLVRLLRLERTTMPCHNTYRRVLREAISLVELQQVTSRYLTEGLDQGHSVLVAIDGKTLRGTIPKGDTKGVHLLAAISLKRGLS